MKVLGDEVFGRGCFIGDPLANLDHT
jgi:hypothetical protein